MKEDNTQIDYTWMAKTGGYAKDMTLRDHFAGLAMQGICANPEDCLDIEEDETWPEYVARSAYEQADKMLKTRNFAKQKNNVENTLHSMQIQDLPLTVRAVNCLHARNIRTVGELLKTTRWDLREVPNLGKRSLLEIEEVLKDLNLQLREM